MRDLRSLPVKVDVRGVVNGRLPLNALRVFEACARHGSFLQAADELARGDISQI